MQAKQLLLLGIITTGAAAGCGSQTGTSGGKGSPGGSAGALAGSAGFNAGTPGTGGSLAGSGGTGGSGVGGTSGAAGAPSICVTATSEISSAIATVGIVTFSSTLAAIDRAHIDFGLDTTYGMQAPVDLAEANYRTLLLGMKQNREYHFRVVVGSGATECTGPDQTIMTGSLPNILPSLEVTNLQRERLFGGFVSTGQYQANGGGSSPAYILDADGDFVWAVRVGNFVTAARQSYDGKYMWINGTDNMNSGMTPANIHRISMDGLVDEDLSEDFGIQDHQMTLLPDESVIFYGHDQECPDIKRRFADGRIETIVNARTAHGVTGACHVNFVEYSPDDQTLVFSDDNHDNFTKITLDGEVVWVMSGMTNQFTGDGAMWDRQHGIDILAVNRFVYFNNGRMGSAQGSIAYELLLDLTAMTATRVWSYQAMPGISNDQLGDVQRLPNGNTVVAYSTQGVLHEVDADGNLLQEIAWPIGGAYGYIHKRASLYGPPPR
jgi:hypothetical protein